MDGYSSKIGHDIQEVTLTNLGNQGILGYKEININVLLCSSTEAGVGGINISHFMPVAAGG